MNALIALCFLAVAAAAGTEQQIEILRQTSDINVDGSYQHAYETSNGISAQEQGVLKNAGNKDTEASEVTGSFDYTGTDGAKYSVHYVANENGFQPEAAHLPVAPEPPAIPAQIQRALDWIAAHPEPEQVGSKKF